MSRKINITLSQPTPLVDFEFFESAIVRVLIEEGIVNATIGLAIVDDAEIRRVNREFLDHDFPTDVISFLLNDPAENREDPDAIARTVLRGMTPDSRANLLDAGESLEGEIIVSLETAVREAEQHGWSPRAELLLYVVHGLLHLCGYDDLTDDARPCDASA